MNPSKFGLDESDECIKCYILFSPQRERNYERELEAIRSAALRREDLHLKSFYWTKSGRVSILLKCIIKGRNYSSLYRALTELNDELRAQRGVEMRMVTLLIAEGASHESDLIVTDVADASGRRWNALVAYLDKSAERQLRGSAQLFLDRLYALFEATAPLARFKAFEDTFGHLMNALANRNAEGVRQAAFSVGRVEKGLREWLSTSLLPARLGPQWHAAMVEKLGLDRSRTELELGVMTRILREYCKDSPEFREEVVSRLGSGWQRTLDAATKARNDMFHYNVVVDWAPDAAGKDSWFEIGSAIAGIAPLYNALVEEEDG